MVAQPPIIELSEFDESKNILVYGESGCGKTTLVGTMPNGLIIGVEKGTISAKRAGSKCKLWPVKNWTDVEKAQIWLRNGGHRRFRWVGLDSLTVMQQMMWRHILDKVVLENRARDLDIPAQHDHLKMQLMLKRFVTLFCDLPINVMFTALEMNIETADGEERVMPYIDGKKGALSQFVAGQMSSYGHMSVHKHSKTGRVMRRITWEADGAYTGKDRYGCLAPKTDDLTVVQIEKLIDSSGTLVRPTVRRTTRRNRG